MDCTSAQALLGLLVTSDMLLDTLVVIDDVWYISGSSHPNIAARLL